MADGGSERYKMEVAITFACAPGLKVGDPRRAIDVEMSILQTCAKEGIISRARVFDGLADGIGLPEKYFSLSIVMAYRSH